MNMRSLIVMCVGEHVQRGSAEMKGLASTHVQYVFEPIDLFKEKTSSIDPL